MQHTLDAQILLPLIDYLSLSRLVFLTRSAKSTLLLLNSTEVLNTLKMKYGNPKAATFTQLYEEYDKVDDLIEATRQDDAALVLLIIKHITAKQDSKEEVLPFIPTLLSIAAILGSVKVFSAVCTIMVHDLDKMFDEEDDMECIAMYLEHVTTETLKTNNSNMYRSFFSTLDRSEAGLEELFEHGIGGDRVQSAMYASYSHVLMSGDDAAYNVMREYFNQEPSENMKYGYEYTRSIDFLHWLVESGKHTREEMMCVGLYTHLRYLKEEITYEEAKRLDEEKDLLTLDKYVSDLRHALAE